MAFTAQAQFVWHDRTFATLAQAETAMRAESTHPGREALELISETQLSGGTNKRVLRYEYRPRSATQFDTRTSAGPVLDQQYVCDANDIATSFACMRASWSQASGITQMVLQHCEPAYMRALNESGRRCVVSVVYDDGTVEPSFGWVTEATIGVCAAPTPNKVLLCPANDELRWVTIRQTGADCHPVLFDIRGFAACEYLTGSPELVFEQRGGPYSLRIDAINSPQTPSPRAVAGDDRAVPVVVTMTRPTPGVAETQRINLSMVVDGNSAGMHDGEAIGSAPRPRGWLLPNTCANRQQRIAGKDQPDISIDVAFAAGATQATRTLCYVVSEYAGTYTLHGTCETKPDCNRSAATVPLEVRIGEIPEDLTTQSPALDVAYIGATDFTPSNHWLQTNHIATFRNVVACWNAARRPRPNRPGQFLDPLLHVNDASLIWGGKFSINGSWSQTGHISHRRGASLDIRGNNQAGAIPAPMRDTFRRCARDEGVSPVFERPPQVRPGQEHFHLNF